MMGEVILNVCFSDGHGRITFKFTLTVPREYHEIKTGTSLSSFSYMITAADILTDIEFRL